MSTPGSTAPTQSRLRRRVWTTLAVASSLFLSMLTLTLASTSGSTPTWNHGIGFTLNLVAAAALVWRHERPWLVLGIALAGPLFFETDATAAVITLFAIAHTTRGRSLIGATLAVYLASSISLTYDAHRTRDNSVLTMGTARPKNGAAIPNWDVALWIPWVAAAFLIAAVVGAALLKRTTSDLNTAVYTRDKVTKQSDAMREQMLLTAERARIARDMHDTLAATLSRISLFAGGLQVNSTDEPEKIAQTASMIRQTAHEGLDELKRIIGVLRGNAEQAGSPHRSSIEGISDLILSARAAGVHASLTLDVEPGEPGPSASQVAYRVAREALTNAGKHAPDSPTHVSVYGSVSRGICVEVRNHLSAMPAFVGGSGAGLAGLAEQVSSVGGTFNASPHAGEFVVRCWLPWHT